MDYKGIDYLRQKLNQKRTRVNVRYKYYEMKNFTEDFDLLIPEKFRGIKEVVGWCSKAVDTLAHNFIVRLCHDRHSHDKQQQERQYSFIVHGRELERLLLLSAAKIIKKKESPPI